MARTLNQYTIVTDNRVPCRSYGGDQLRGSFGVVVGGATVWLESDTWQSAASAEAKCERVAELLQTAYNHGKYAASRTRSKKGVK